jgi:hypothetical protein
MIFDPNHMVNPVPKCLAVGYPTLGSSRYHKALGEISVYVNSGDHCSHTSVNIPSYFLGGIICMFFKYGLWDILYRFFALFKMQAKPPRVGSFHYITSLT